MELKMSPLQKYLARRVIYSFITVFAIVFMVFTLSRLAGDPVEAYVTPETPPEIVEVIRKKYHLDEPIPVQFVFWVQGLLQGEWGRAFSFGEEPILELIRRLFPLTLELNIYVMIIALPLGYWIGTKAATNKDSWIDHLARILAIMGNSLPTFFTGLLLLAFLYTRGMVVIDPRFSFPKVTGMPTVDAVLAGDWTGFIEAWRYLIGPLITSVFSRLATNTRVLRSSILEELSKDYITTGKSKGLSKDYIDKKYARRNAMIPFTTLLGFWVAGMVSGNAILEAVFNRSGLGSVAAAAARVTDHNTVQAISLIFAVALVFTNLLIDIAYGFIDPRIKYGEKK
jgi:peptide/nickel transport system permease protein